MTELTEAPEQRPEPFADPASPSDPETPADGDRIACPTCATHYRPKLTYGECPVCGTSAPGEHAVQRRLDDDTRVTALVVGSMLANLLILAVLGILYLNS